MKGFISEGKDGYKACKKIIQFLIVHQNGKIIQDAWIKFFKSISPEATQDMKDKKREERLKIFNTNEDDTTPDGFIKIRPMVDGRMINIREDQ